MKRFRDPEKTLRRNLWASFRLAVVLAAAAAVLFGCASLSPLPGEDLVLAARKMYTSLDSARVSVVNGFTGETEQEFVFKYDEKGLMTYSYVGRSEGVYLAQYNNGREQFTNDNGSVSALDASDLSFTAYSRDVPYPMAGEGMILFYKKGVTSAGTVASEDGGTVVNYGYDVHKLGEYDGEGELAGFSVSYRFDSDGEFVSMDQRTDVNIDGEIVSYLYTIYINDRNSVERVENVVDISSLDN